MRLVWGVLCTVACVHDGIAVQRDACSRDHGDPEACLAVARERFGAKDNDAAVAMLEKEIALVENDRACLAHFPAGACFHGVVALLREPAAGLLADYAIDPALLALREPWTGKDSEGPHAQARVVLEGMCAQGDDTVARQRACLVLGDLVLLERTKQTAGFETAPDGYALACKIGASEPVFAKLVMTTYHVATVCEVATSTQRGASIADGPATIARIAQDAAQREASAADAAAREAARIAQVKQREADAAAAAAHDAVATSNRQIIASITAEDWDLLLETLRARPGMGPLDEAAATALDKTWEVFSTWLVAQSNLVGAQVEVARDLRDAVPPGHALAQTQMILKTRAIAEAKRLAKLAGGPGGRFLHAALIAAVANDPTADAAARAAYAELQKAVRATLVLDKLAPSCAALARSPAPQPLWQPVHATASLVCSIEPEHTWTMQESYMVNGKSTPTEVEHRGYKLVVHGTIAANGQTIPVDVDAVVDEALDKLDRPYTVALAALVDGLWTQLVAPVEAATASDALAAGQKAVAQHNVKRAENELAIHALIAGSSEELDKLLAPYHVTFGQLVPAAP